MEKITGKKKWLLLQTVQKQNILPLTSKCNMDCVFCSHKSNPSSIETFRWGHLSLALIKELLEYLPPGGTVTLGESATKIIEGEPFAHPDFKQILSLIREKWPQKKINIATNGSFLTGEMVEFLKKMKPISLNVSLNTPDTKSREIIMKDTNPEQVFKGLKLLSESNINFHGSIVALPHILGWDSLKETLYKLNSFHPVTIRVFRPGFTNLTSEKFKFNQDLWEKLREFINKIKFELKTPVVLEPPLLKKLKPEVTGIIQESPAAAAGVEIGDCIQKINGKKPLTRVEAYNILNNTANPLLEIRRSKRVVKKSLDKVQDQKSGIVFNYDISRQRISDLQKIINNNIDKKIVIITSELGKYIMQETLDYISQKLPPFKYQSVVVPNNYLGGSIRCTGLLVTEDIINIIEDKDLKRYDLMIIPEEIYDIEDKDLTGTSYTKIGKKYNFVIKFA